MRSIVVQKAVIVDTTGKILLLRRSKSDVRRPLQWDLPGGLVDEGEELISSIRREVKEESGLDVDKLTPVFTTTAIRSWKDQDGNHTDNVSFIFYKAVAETNDVVISYEHDQFQWVTPDVVTGQFEYDLHKQALEYILTNNLLSNHE